MAIEGDYVGMCMYMCIRSRQQGSRAARHTIGSRCKVCGMRANEMLELKLRRHSADLGQRDGGGGIDGCKCVMHAICRSGSKRNVRRTMKGCKGLKQSELKSLRECA